MATTTAAAIRNEMITLVAAITPAVHSAQRFVAHREEMPLRDWAAANPKACLRRFSIRFAGATEPPRVNDTLVQEVQDVAEVIVAYPRTWRHGGTQLLGLDDVIASDATAIERTIGPPGYATLAGLIAPCAVLWEQANERDEVGPVVFSLIRYRVDYFRSLS